MQTSLEQLQNYIGGAFQAPFSGQYLPNVAPATGQVYSFIPDSTAEDIEQAVAAAEAAFPAWSTCGIDVRARFLEQIAAGIEARMEEFVQAESHDNGKPIRLAAAVDIPRAAANFRFFSRAITQQHSESHYMEGAQAINYTLRRPIGVVACISPWNLPLYLFTWKIAPALAAGNCVVAKPSEVTPKTAYLLAQVCKEVGLPEGVLNIVHGLGAKAGKALVTHSKVKAISFTGGTQTGQEIARLAAPQFKKLSLELGGKNATLVFEDCDFEQTVETAVRAAFANQGQICLCGSRIFVQASIYEAFKKAFVERVQALRVAPPNDAEADLSALVSEAHLKKVQTYIQLAEEEGGRILCGGQRLQMQPPYAEGYYLSPTVVEGLDPYCRTNQEEIFGPVVSLIPFDTEAQAIEWANCTPYGLAFSVWTTQLQRAHRIAEALQAGIVWVNCWMLRDLRTPFGGVKASGVGREGGWEALRFFTEPKNICIKH